MRTKPGTLVILVSFGVASALTVLALARAGFAQTLVQNFPCTSPNQGDTQYCTMYQVNPCGRVPNNCFAFGRWFSEDPPVGCPDDPGQTTASGDGTVANGTWTGCSTGYVPSSSCQMSEQVCGTLNTYWGANCQQATFCGNVNMLACEGAAYVSCPGGPE